MDGQRVIDIVSRGEYPANALSNFYPHSFVFDGVECASMEGLLQSLKTKSVARQRAVCALCGREAKLAFHHRLPSIRWKITGRLYWKGRAMRRSGDEYQRFLDAAFDALYTSGSFVGALESTGAAVLTHSIGKDNSRRTILTEYEFVTRLNRLRDRGCK